MRQKKSMAKTNLFLCLFSFLLFRAVHSNADWCEAKSSATSAQLQAAINFCCGQPSVDCKAIRPGGSCFEPNTLANHASWALDQYYKASHTCNQLGTASTISVTDPSFGSCRYPPK